MLCTVRSKKAKKKPVTKGLPTISLLTFDNIIAMSNLHFQENQLDYRSSQTPVTRKTGDTNGRRQFGQVDRVVDLLCESSSSSPQTGFYLHSPDFKSSPTRHKMLCLLPAEVAIIVSFELFISLSLKSPIMEETNLSIYHYHYYLCPSC